MKTEEDTTLGTRVKELLTRSRAETEHLSSSTQRTDHPAYQELIAEGQAAIPFLLADMARTFDGHLGKALKALTAAQPVAPEDRGKVRKVAEAWLAWAKENGYSW